MRPTPNPLRRSVLPLAAGLLALVAAAAAQSGPAQSREATWWPPTAEEWRRPCLIRWQRTWEDAQALSKQTGKAILVCINMDGEIASEHYAGVRYRQPEIAELYDQYVCVIASVYRHTPRDHDEQGRRVVCPRFGSVTCGEHIAMEGHAYAQYLDGQRVAPRHIGVELEGAAPGTGGAEMFDVFYAWDTDSVFNSVRQGVANRVAPERPPLPSDPSLPELLASPDSKRREEVEALWAQGDRELRRSLLEAALAQGGAAPVELLRLALSSGDAELAGLARRALAQAQSPGAADAIIDSLDLPMPASDRQALVEALERLGVDSPRARSIAQARSGLAAPAKVDVAGWSSALAAQSSYEAAAAEPLRAERLSRQDEILASSDGPAHVELAESLLALAEAEPDPQLARPLFLDAQRAAGRAEALGAKGARSNSVLALAALALGDTDEALRRLDDGVGSVAAVPGSRGAMEMLELFAQSRQAAIARAVRAGESWPPQWLADVDAAYSVLVKHPRGTDRQALMHYDFVNWFGADARAEQILEQSLARFPGSFDLHDRLRARLLRSRGVYGLEAEYEARLQALAAQPGATPASLAQLESLAGYASLVAAEFQRREGRADEAQAAYDRAIRHYERSLAGDPAALDPADHYVALALAGRARLAFERGEDARALDELLSCFAREPQAAATPDGLSVSAVDTARLLQGRLRQQGRQDLLAVLDTALAQLDPALLGRPAFERDQPAER